HNRLVFGAEGIEVQSRLSNPMIAKQIEKLAEELLAQVNPDGTFAVRASAAVRTLLAHGQRADRAAVARRLHVSPRTLLRGLKAAQTTFKAVRDAVVWEVVEALLSNRALKLEAVASSVGFGDAATFSKAFKRWAGCSPTTYRERLGQAARRA